MDQGARVLTASILILGAAILFFILAGVYSIRQGNQYKRAKAEAMKTVREYAQWAVGAVLQAKQD